MLEFKADMDVCKVTTAITFYDVQETHFKEFRWLCCVFNITVVSFMICYFGIEVRVT
jgi:hypothetical protein